MTKHAVVAGFLLALILVACKEPVPTPVVTEVSSNGDGPAVSAQGDADVAVALETQADIESAPTDADMLVAAFDVPAANDDTSAVEALPNETDTQQADLVAALADGGDGAGQQDVTPATTADVVVDAAAESAGVATPTGICADGLELPLPGESCPMLGAASCTRVGEGPVNAPVPGGTFTQVCRRPNRVSCTKSQDGTLKWQVAACPKATKQCGGWGADWGCQSGAGGVATCCPLWAQVPYVQGLPSLDIARFWNPSELGQKQCSSFGGFGPISQCSTYLDARSKVIGITPEQFDQALGSCMSKDPACVAYFPIEVCKVLNWKQCAGYADFKDLDAKNAWCEPNYEGKGPGCLNTCGDLKKYCKTCTPWYAP